MFNETIIMKPFIIEGVSTWSDSVGKCNGVLRIFPETMEIEVKLFSGSDPNASDLMKFVINDKDVKLMLRKYYQKGRKDRYAVNISRGMSGREDVYINYYDEYGLQIRGKHLFHISCFEKLGYVKKMYIGDFAEGVYAYRPRDIKTTGRYVKPYFEPKEGASTEVHKIL